MYAEIDPLCVCMLMSQPCNRHAGMAVIIAIEIIEALEFTEAEGREFVHDSRVPEKNETEGHFFASLTITLMSLTRMSA
jgi:hypothetical protein